MSFKPYLPRPDLDAVDWMRRFVNAAAGDPRRLGLAGEEVARADGVQRALAAAVARARSSVGNAVDATVKARLRGEAEAVFRPLAMRVKRDAAVSADVKLKLGLRPPRGEGAGRGTPVGPPTTAPELVSVAVVDGGHRLRYQDPRTPASAALPREATGLLLFAHVADRGGTSPIDDPSRASLLRGYTRTPLRIELPLEARGRLVTYFGRWQGKHGHLGPWSKPRWSWAACPRGAIAGGRTPPTRVRLPR